MLLSDPVVQVTLENALTGCSEIAEPRDYRRPLAAFLPGVLKESDLPGCCRAFGPERLRQLEPWGRTP